MSKRIYLSSPHMGGTEIKYVQEAFDTNWISPVGPHLSAFEKAVCDYTGAKNAAALSSGTAAIHLALVILGVQQGDDVICSSFTFAGSCNPILYQKANPIFIDSEEATWNMDPGLLEQAIKDRIKMGRKPKAIIMVHLYGMPAKINEIMTVARQYEIPVVEDAAEALGSKYENQYVGTFGDIGVFSFNGNKIITTSGGGMLASDDQSIVEKAKFLATQARDQAPHYEHSELGFNYRLSNISAGIGRGQMEVLNEHIDKRRRIYRFYEESLNGYDGILFLNEPANAFSNRWLTTILFDEDKCKVDKETVRLELEKDNIESRPVWKPMHLQPLYKGAIFNGNGVSEKLFSRGLCLPSGSNMSNKDLDRVKFKLLSILS